MTFAVATVDDSDAEGHSVVTVEVTGGAGYSFYPSNAESVAVYDNDDTTPTVAVWPVNRLAVEGSEPGFTVIHTGAATTSVTVALTVTESGDMLYPANRGATSRRQRH